MHISVNNPLVFSGGRDDLPMLMTGRQLYPDASDFSISISPDDESYATGMLLVEDGTFTFTCYDPGQMHRIIFEAHLSGYTVTFEGAENLFPVAIGTYYFNTDYMPDEWHIMDVVNLLNSLDDLRVLTANVFGESWTYKVATAKAAERRKRIDKYGWWHKRQNMAA